MALKRLVLVLVVSLRMTTAVNVPFSPSTTLTHKRSKWTAQVPAPTPAPDLRRQLFPRDASTCGIPEGGYTDAAPVCSGSASFCTFTGSTGYQGCCKDQSLDFCTFYTTCYPYSKQASCTGACTSSALVCPSSAPQCTQYTYQWEPNPPESHWTGFGCGSQTATIYAFAVNGMEGSQSASATVTATASDPSSSAASNSLSKSPSSPTTSSHTHSSTSQSTASQTILPSPTGPSSGSATSTATRAAASSSNTSNPSISHSHNHTGAIVGGVVGGIAFLGILLAAIIMLRIRGKRKERGRRAPMSQRELGQPWPR